MKQESTLVHLPEDIRSEFEVDSDGKVFAKSIRAVARLAGVSVSALNDSGRLLDKLLTTKNLPDCLKPFAGFDWKVTTKIPDLLIAGIVEYYAFYSSASNETARRVYRAMATVGIRAYFQQELGWKPQIQHQPKTHAELTQE